MNSPPRVFGLKDPIVQTGQQMPAGANHAAPAGALRPPRLRAVRAVYKILLEQFMFLIFGDAVCGPSLLRVASTAAVLFWNRMLGNRSGKDLGKTEKEDVLVQAKPSENGKD